MVVLLGRLTASTNPAGGDRGTEWKWYYGIVKENKRKVVEKIVVKAMEEY